MGNMGLNKWATDVAKSMADKAENWALTKLTPLTKMSPLFWVAIDTIMSVRRFHMISYKDHAMRFGRFVMGMGYLVILPHPSAFNFAFLSLNPWF